MRIYKWVFSVLLLLVFASVVQAGLFSKSPVIVVSVVDLNNKPVVDASVTFSFRNYPQDDKFQAITNQEGYAQVKRFGDQRVSINVDKEGYYYSQKVVEFNEAKKNTQDRMYKIVMKMKQNPIPMYSKNARGLKIPVFDEAIGFDLEVGDWVMPYGKGNIEDFVFTFHKKETSYTSYSRTVMIDSLKVDFVADKRSNAKKTTSTGGELA